MMQWWRSASSSLSLDLVGWARLSQTRLMVKDVTGDQRELLSLEEALVQVMPSPYSAPTEAPTGRAADTPSPARPA